MTAERIDIWNSACDWLGVQRIVTETEDTAPARTMLAAWPEFRQQFLIVAEPRGAVRTSALVDAADIDVIPERWLYVYDLPLDFLKSISFNRTPVRVGIGQWDIELAPEVNRKVLYTNMRDLAQLEYVLDVGNQVFLLDPLTRSAMAMELALYTARALGLSSGDINQMKELMNDKLLDAMGSDGQQGSSVGWSAAPPEVARARAPESRHTTSESRPGYPGLY